MLSPGVIVEEGAIVRNSIVFHESVIKKGAVLDRVISDKDVIVGEQSHVGTGDESVVNEDFPEFFYSGITILGKESQVGTNVRVGRNVLVYPGTAVQDDSVIESGKMIREDVTKVPKVES